MKIFLRICLFNAFAFLLISQAWSQKTTTVDICVYGGSSAGVIAAYTAKKLGKSVIVIEPGKHLGGLTSGGLGFTDIGNKYAVSGLARDFYRRIGNHYGKFEQWIFEPHVAENIYKEYVKQAKVNILFGHRIIDARTKDGYIQEIMVENSTTPVASTNQIIRAKMFIDCSYEGDLMAKAGVSYFVGREANDLYNETYNGVQLKDKHQFVDGIDPYKTPGKPESGLLWGISNETLLPEGSGDKKVQAYNFRICLSRDPKNLMPIVKPDDYDSTRYELLIRMLEKEPNRPFNLILKPDLMPNEKTDINNNGPFSTDMIGMNYNYPEASYDQRTKIVKEHENYNKGLLYFIGHSGRIPKPLREEMLKWGYPKDEYTDNGHWSPQMYVREARRMVGSYVMTQANCEGKEKVSDGVGMAAYTMDSHNTSRIVINGMVKNEGDVQVGGFPPYPISYRSLIPKASDCKNLFVPVCLSATHIAYGSIRMEPVFMVLAQSSATAAVQAIDRNVSVQEVDVETLQKKLMEDPLVDGSTPEILIDNDDKESITTTGNWTHEKNGRGCYAFSFLKSPMDNNKTIQSVRFNPLVKSAGKYEVFIYFPRLEGASTTVTTIIHTGKKEQEVVLRPNEIKVEGQTSGEWIAAGKYDFSKGKDSTVEISTKNADGIVIADAVLFIPLKSN
ncbi:FAD-dependent oxidoreductase [Chryseolinea sp. H1M3-3]|uniref:FAD-dependent oxidoreductase n=1 Tax=Chryseolinea sp. H1M3-3 TaxID=3034144 RepID=UPI0023EB6E3E|nr:FAD-dependent oxidoreductase [Chryseolinea sp. H1M3-3]